MDSQRPRVSMDRWMKVQEGIFNEEPRVSKVNKVVTLFEEYQALSEKIRGALTFSEFINLETERVGIGTRSKPRGMHKGFGENTPTLVKKSSILLAKQGVAMELVEEENITPTDNKEPKGEELNLGKSHQDIPSTCEQGMMVVQREEAPSIKEDKEKEDESLVAIPRIEYISDLLLPSSPSHGVDHHHQFDTNMGRMRCTLSDKGYLHPFWKTPSYACIKTSATLGTRAEIEVTKGNLLSKAHGLHTKVTISSFSLVGHPLDILMFERLIWSCVDNTSTSPFGPWKWEKTPHKEQDEGAGLYLTAAKRRSIEENLSPMKAQEHGEIVKQSSNQAKKKSYEGHRQPMAQRNPKFITYQYVRSELRKGRYYYSCDVILFPIPKNGLYMFSLGNNSKEVNRGVGMHCLYKELNFEWREGNEGKEVAANSEPIQEDVSKSDPEEISTLATLSKVPGYHPFKGKGILHGKKVTVLIDCGATHHFIDERLVSKMRLKVEEFKGFNVIVADWACLTTDYTFQRYIITVWRENIQSILHNDLFLAPTKGCLEVDFESSARLNLVQLSAEGLSRNHKGDVMATYAAAMGKAVYNVAVKIVAIRGLKYLISRHITYTEIGCDLKRRGLLTVCSSLASSTRLAVGLPKHQTRDLQHNCHAASRLSVWRAGKLWKPYADLCNCIPFLPWEAVRKCRSRQKHQTYPYQLETILGLSLPKQARCLSWLTSLPTGTRFKQKSSKAANKKSQVPDFVDEEELLKSLELRFESDVDVERTRHYEIMYLIHEDNANEVQEVISMVKDFVEERKGKTWRINDW
ncbi:hypothetical protein KI387_028137, partial [Taxus chinensis]